MPRPRLSVAGLMTVVLILSVGLVSLRIVSAVWAGVLLTATLATLATAILGVVYRREGERAYWLGFALFGWGYLALASWTWWDRGVDRPVLITTMVLDRLYPILRPEGGPGEAGAALDRLLVPNPANRKILAQLDQSVSMSFANQTPLVDVLSYIKLTTAGPNGGKGIPIYVDPVGLQEAEVTMTSPVTMAVEDIPLRTGLRLLLRQLGLAYIVKDGLLTISSEELLRTFQVPNGILTPLAFRRAGHCLWALLAAWVGGLAGRAFHASRDAGPRMGRTIAPEGGGPG